MLMVNSNCVSRTSLDWSYNHYSAMLAFYVLTCPHPPQSLYILPVACGLITPVLILEEPPLILLSLFFISSLSVSASTLTALRHWWRYRKSYLIFCIQICMRSLNVNNVTS